MNTRFKSLYIDIARRASKMSRAQRLQVGAVIVHEGNIISYSWNGTPSGWDNSCEDIVWDPGSGPYLNPGEFERMYPFEKWHDGAQRMVRYGLKTKPEVIHAEANALDKLAAKNGGARGASMFITHAPCLECAKRIANVGIKSVFYSELYRDTAGIEHLRRSGVEVEQVILENV